MTDTQDIFAVVWIDRLLGPLSLPAVDAQGAKMKAREIYARGSDKIHSIRAVRHVFGSRTLDTLEDLAPLADLSDRTINYIAPMACGSAERAEATRRYNTRSNPP